jgi:hypothetical protein
MRSVQYRRWNPPQSPLQIEFPADLLPELQPGAGALENSGILYGLRRGREIRVLTARLEPGEVLESVGVFVSRSRGEVFLTESNLGFFEREGVAVALVIAGDNAGFFVRESDESIQTVRSHEEFPVLNQPTRAEPPAPPKPVTRASNRMPNKAWSVAGLIALIMLPMGALAYLRPVLPQRPPAPLSLRVQEEGGQLQISQLHIRWTSGGHAILEIVDGAERTAVTVPPDQSNATYVRRSSEVQISLIHLDGEPARRESVHFVGQPLPALPTGPLASEIEQSRTEADGLRAEAAATRARIASLQQAISRLTAKRR